MNTEYERLQARILIQHKEGGTLAYLYNRESLQSLGMFESSYDKTKFIEIGHIINLGERKIRVVDINFKLETQLWEMDNEKGTNIYSPTEPTDFNCQIGIFVEDVE